MRRSTAWWGCSCSYLSLCAAARAQETRGGSIEGIVKDTSRGGAARRDGQARSAALVGVSTTVSDANGIYRFPALPPGCIG